MTQKIVIPLYNFQVGDISPVSFVASQAVNVDSTIADALVLEGKAVYGSNAFASNQTSINTIYINQANQLNLIGTLNAKIADLNSQIITLQDQLSDCQAGNSSTARDFSTDFDNNEA